jgi:hypothetical protein
VTSGSESVGGGAGSEQKHGVFRNQQVESMMSQGARGYIQKSFSTEELVNKVAETLGTA